MDYPPPTQKTKNKNENQPINQTKYHPSYMQNHLKENQSIICHFQKEYLFFIFEVLKRKMIIDGKSHVASYVPPNCWHWWKHDSFQLIPGELKFLLIWSFREKKMIFARFFQVMMCFWEISTVPWSSNWFHWSIAVISLNGSLVASRC